MSKTNWASSPSQRSSVGHTNELNSIDTKGSINAYREPNTPYGGQASAKRLSTQWRNVTHVAKRKNSLQHFHGRKTYSSGKRANTYLYYSRYIEIAKLTTTDVIKHLKSLGTESLKSCSGPQYSSEMFSIFSQEYKFAHKTSSPRYPQANGAAVKTIKLLLDKNTDPYLALLSYRSTPLANGQPSYWWVDVFARHSQTNWTRDCRSYGKRRRIVTSTKGLWPLQTGGSVWIPDGSTEGTVTAMAVIFGQYSGSLRRNRRGSPRSRDRVRATATVW